MTIAELVSWGAVVTAVTTAFLLGFAPELIIRLVTLLYPAGNPRRRELIAEVAHVSRLSRVPQTWFWIGQVMCTALFEGSAERGRLALLSVRRRLTRRRNGYSHVVEITRVFVDGSTIVTLDRTDAGATSEAFIEKYAARTDRPERIEVRVMRRAPGRHKRTRRDR